MSVSFEKWLVALHLLKLIVEENCVYPNTHSLLWRLELLATRLRTSREHNMRMYYKDTRDGKVILLSDAEARHFMQNL